MKIHSFIFLFALLLVFAGTVHAGLTDNLNYKNTAQSCQQCGGKIIVIADVVPGTNSHQYLFSASGIPLANTFTLSDNGIAGNNTAVLYAPNGGFYIVSEIVNPHFPFLSLSCIDPSNDTMVNTNSAYIMLSGNETVVCTFINQQVAQKPRLLPSL